MLTGSLGVSHCWVGEASYAAARRRRRQMFKRAERPMGGVARAGRQQWAAGVCAGRKGV